MVITLCKHARKITVQKTLLCWGDISRRNACFAQIFELTTSIQTPLVTEGGTLKNNMILKSQWPDTELLSNQT